MDVPFGTSVKSRTSAPGSLGLSSSHARAWARADGSPRDVDRELVVLFALEDENQSLYMPQNLGRAGNPAAISLADRFNPFGPFYASQRAGVHQRVPVREHAIANDADWATRALVSSWDASDALDYHNVHWHGNTATAAGMRTDTVPLLSGGMAVADMIPDNPGTWLFHCHVGYHLDGGMVGLYRVTP